MNKNAYLTVDDAPSADFTKRLHYLKALQLPAVIFCIGQQLFGHEKEIVEAIQQGFVIGNHSFTHPRFSQLSLSQIEQEISKTDLLIDNLYQRAQQKRTKKLFRFPFGDPGHKFVDETQRILKQYGYTLPPLADITYPFYKKHVQQRRVDVPWTFNIMEYHLTAWPNVKKRIASKDGTLSVGIREPGGYLDSDSAEIVLIHDFTETGHMFEPIIEELLARGIVFQPMLKPASKTLKM